MKTLEDFTEFESKYSSDIAVLTDFKQLASSVPDLKKFTYAEGPDVFYEHPLLPAGSFGRYRKASFDTFAQWTIKIKPEGAKNNLKRKEPNWRVDGTKSEEIHAGAIAMGFQKKFQIYKMCHIYEYDDAIVVFYSSSKDGSTDIDHFIEIEVAEDTIGTKTEEEALAVIEKYEKLLKPIGITPQKRMKLSLYEFYSRK